MNLSEYESAELSHLYSTGAIIYKRFKMGETRSLDQMGSRGSIEWFALTSDYGVESYGPIVHSYVIRDRPRLINVGLDSVRARLRERAELGEGTRLDFSSNQQWSGGKANFEFCNLVRKYFQDEYDGTIIHSGQPSLCATDEENEGATEIVIWKDHSRILSPV